MTQATPTTLVIPQDLGGLRLDQALQRMLPEHSRSRLQTWIKEGLVTVDGSESTSKTKVWGGEQVLVQAQEKPEVMAFQAENIPLNILGLNMKRIAFIKPPLKKLIMVSINPPPPSPPPSLPSFVGLGP